MPLLNYTSNVDADKTAQEISKCLSMHGARAVLTEYDDKEQVIKAISFKISLNEKEITFRLPCDWHPVYEVIKIQFPMKHRRGLYGDDLRKDIEHKESEMRLQAVRTAWRIVKDWVEAQMALVETHMVTTVQVFLPYAVMKNGKTLSEGVLEDPGRLLGNGN